MFSTLKLMDTVALQNNITANSALDVSSDNHYCIVTEDGLYILYLCGFMDTTSSSMSFKKLFVTIPEYSPSSDLGMNLNLFLSDLPQNELYETLLELDISEKVRDVTHVKQQPVQAKWSPLGLISNNGSAIATLTNRGSLNVFVHTVNEVEIEEYVSIVNITKCYIAHTKPSWLGITRAPVHQLQELKFRLCAILPTGFTWSNLIKIGSRYFCFLLVAHLNGELSVWRIYQRTPNQIDGSGIKFISKYKTDLKRITALSWQQLGDNGLLLVGDIEGKVKLISVTDITEKSLSISSDMYLWDELDRIKVEYFKVVINTEMKYILIVKGSSLLICLINGSGDIVDIHNFQAGNFQISGIEHIEDNTLLVLTHTGVLKEIKLLVEDCKLRIDWKHIYIDYPWHFHQTHGLVISSNKIFLAVLVGMAKLNDIRRKKSHIKLLIFKNMAKNPLKVLMKNPSESLTSFWDCLEILRLNGIIEKKLPCDGLPSGLNYDKLSITQLKTCLWLSKSSETLFDNKVHVLEDRNLLCSEELKYILQMKLACKHIKLLLEEIANGKVLREFHMQSLGILNMYLKEIVADNTIPNFGLGKNTVDEMYDVISTANELLYPGPPKCKLCNDDIIGSSCIPPHLDTRCSRSLMQVVGLPYYKCPFCACVVHWKLIEIYNNILCPFCDISMNFVSVVTENTGHPQALEISSCSHDCIEKIIDLTDIEDHAFTNMEEKGEYLNLVAVSSDEEDKGSSDDDSTNIEMEV